MSDTRSVNDIDVDYVAKLARLKLSRAELETFQGQLGRIVDYVHKINELNLEGIEPTSHASAVVNVFRDDKARPGLDRERALANAPSHAQGQFRVPRIVE